MQQELEAMRKALVIRNYATKTVNTHVSVLKRFLEQLDKPIASLPRRHGQTPVGPDALLPNGYGTREKRAIVPPPFIAKPNHPLRSRHFSDLRRPIGGAIIFSLP